MSELQTAKLNMLISNAYMEDLGDNGDITTRSTIPALTEATAQLNSREKGVLCGLDIFVTCLTYIDNTLIINLNFKDGDNINPGDTIATIKGSARSILSAERVALNFVSHLTGIATLTARYVDQIKHTKANIACTRKTMPGLRALQKYAVKCGGGMNHRFGLYDAVLIKDNHIAACGGIASAIKNAKLHVGHMVKIEVELDTIADIEEALSEFPDIIMLDNMTPKELSIGVKQIDGRALVEASGSIALKTVCDIAESGVDIISVGKLTHSAPNFDFGLDFNS